MGPVARDGFLFVPGNDYLYGLDAFNGTAPWETSFCMQRRAATALSWTA